MEKLKCVLQKLLKHFEGSNYASMCICANDVLSTSERNIFKTFYEHAVRNRTVFYYRSGERVHEYDFYGFSSYYLFKPYDNERRVKWLNSKIKKLTKK